MKNKRPKDSTIANIFVYLIALISGVCLASLTKSDLWQNIGWILVGASIGKFIEALVNFFKHKEEKEEQTRKLEQEFNDLVHQMGSSINANAVEATRKLVNKRWHHLINEENFSGANLQSADLSHFIATKCWFKKTNLEGANLSYGSFSGSDFQEANLEKANLQSVNLSSASIGARGETPTNLRFANLMFGDLRNSILAISDLSGADLIYAKLEGAFIGDEKIHVVIDRETILPDGKHSYDPDPNTSWRVLERFTQRNHPQFYEPPDIERTLRNIRAKDRAFLSGITRMIINAMAKDKKENRK